MLHIIPLDYWQDYWGVLPIVKVEWFYVIIKGKALFVVWKHVLKLIPVWI